jgi:hypothetical protein
MLKSLFVALSAILAMPGEPTTPGDKTVTAPKFEPIPGKAIGVLVTDVMHMAVREGRTGPAGAVGFVRADGSFRWLYLPAPGDPDADDLTFALGADGKEHKLFPKVRLATREMVKPLGLTGPFHLVEVEVNGGAGSASEEGFVATSLKRLDGTKDYPIKLTEVMRDLKERTQKQATEKKADIARAMEAARDKVAKGRKPTGPEETSEEVATTWLPDRNRLRIEIRRQVTNGFYVVGQGVEGPANKVTRAGTQFGAAGGARFEVGPSGRVEAETPLPYEAFTRELALPQGTDRR